MTLIIYWFLGFQIKAVQIASKKNITEAIGLVSGAMCQTEPKMFTHSKVSPFQIVCSLYLYSFVDPDPKANAIYNHSLAQMSRRCFKI